MSLLHSIPFRHAIYFLACHKWTYMSKFQTFIRAVSFLNPEWDSSSPVSRILVVSPTWYKTVLEKHLFWIKITSVLRFPHPTSSSHPFNWHYLETCRASWGETTRNKLNVGSDHREMTVNFAKICVISSLRRHVNEAYSLSRKVGKNL